jgi:hypothetical protein
MIEPSLDHQLTRSSLQPFRPRQKMNSAREFLLATAISYQTYETTSLEDQTSKCWKSITMQIVDIDLPRSTSKAGPYSCTGWTGESFQNGRDGGN